MSQLQRRAFLKALGLLSASQGFAAGWPGGDKPSGPPKVFKLGSISDEWTPDLEKALQLMKGYGLSWVEIRTVWGVYNTEASPQQVKKIKSLVQQYGFKVSVVDTALYKCTLPGTEPLPGERHDYSPAQEKSLYAGQMDLLKRAIERAHELGTDKVRVFSFWRVANPERYYSRIADELSKAAELAKRSGIRVMLENESACNVATGHESAKILARVKASNFGANWDIGNGYPLGEASYPDGYNALPKDRIWHMHIKDMRCSPGSKSCHTVIAGQGQVDLLGQLRALVRNGYQGTMSLEPEFQTKTISHLEGTERSMQGLLRIMHQAVT